MIAYQRPFVIRTWRLLLGTAPLDVRARGLRFVLAFAYAALTAWATAGDRHGHAAAAETHCSTTCQDPSPHLSGHPSPDLTHAQVDCPACQFRSNLHFAGPEAPALAQSPGTEPSPPPAPESSHPLAPGSPSPRGPPAS